MLLRLMMKVEEAVKDEEEQEELKKNEEGRGVQMLSIARKLALDGGWDNCSWIGGLID